MTALSARIRPLGMSRLWTDAPALTGLALFIALTAVPVMGAALIDPRSFLDAPVWQKPLQFHLALSVYVLTLAFFARFLPPGMTADRRWRGYVGVIAVCVLAELAWIGGAASFGVASHFNVDDPVMAAIYGVMGLFAVTLTSACLVMGVAIWRNPASTLTPAMRLAIALGLILTFVLTLIAAGTMSSMPGHHVGTPVTGARVPVVGWSREVGDLRVAHFLATHALHVVPLAGFTGSRPLVWATALGFAAVTLAVFVLGLAGRPVI
jgi:hypothetical protein